MYGIFSRCVGPRPAKVFTALVYVIMLLLVLYFAFEPQAEFNYLTL